MKSNENHMKSDEIHMKSYENPHEIPEQINAKKKKITLNHYFYMLFYMEPKMDSELFAIFYKKIRLGKPMPRELMRASGVKTVMCSSRNSVFFFSYESGQIPSSPGRIEIPAGSSEN